MIDIAAKKAGYRGRGQEEHLFAAVVAAREARLAFVADDVWLDGYAVADLQVGD